MREVFEALSIFDWITPAKGFIEDIINDPTPLQSNSWTFFIPYGAAIGSGHSARQIEKMLDQAGVHHWGSQITGGEFFFTVPKDQAHTAEFILGEAGVPVGLGAGAPIPEEKPMSNFNNISNFAPIGVIHIGPPAHHRLIKWAFCKVFG